MDVRAMAMALPGSTESPHFDYWSFRVAKKIFATMPPDGAHLHVFVDEARARVLAEENPGVVEVLWWGKKVAGARVALERVSEAQVGAWLREAWERRAPKRR